MKKFGSPVYLRDLSKESQDDFTRNREATLPAKLLAAIKKAIENEEDILLRPWPKMQMFIHDVVSIKIEPVKEQKPHHHITDPYYARSVRIVKKNGETIDVSLFSEGPHDLDGVKVHEC
jgi:hypothetical protein